ncbi:hypothetical protein like AT2G36480 [Hibiscus trionum]|uniref:CID domain-containing protein n=1 Tax=Hibiscus trionum TaxID=183268 RepID=A0A9W7H5Y3_HIBTR|nr:hypothetical protein like AT2G36480 [Hibiscus trionum]
MENTRRPFDRSREPGLKRPRLSEDLAPNPNGRPFPKRTNPVGPASALRFPSSGSDNNDLSGGAYEPQPLSHQQLQQQQYQELVNQYKTALAELTFNSKQIITNLTIIAGENIQAANAIAATVCNNILEVASDQKLPSLYLLDSIVKNIGRDYIKYFASRLPEVFCKAYRQVDPPMHQSMRHLFGTWKGVFPLQSLQVIEKELGFAHLINGSSSGTTASRPDPLSQRPQPSIHINPKYLEKQRLQQSSRVKGMVNDMTGTLSDSKEDSKRPDRAAITAGRPSVDSSIKMNTACMGVGRTSGKVTDQGHNRAWYGGKSSVPETISGQRNGFNIKHGSQNYSTSKSVTTGSHIRATQNIASRSSSGLSSSWKNSDEEEFMWDMHSRLSECDVANLSNNSRQDPWAPDVSEKMDLESQLRKAQSIHDVGPFDRETSDSLSTEQKDEPSYEHQNSSATIGGLLAGASSSLARIGVRPKVGSSQLGTSGFGSLANVASGSAGTFEQRHFQSLRAASPLEQSPMCQHSLPPSLAAHNPRQQLHKSAEQDYLQAHSSGKLNVGSQKHSPSASISSFQPSHHTTFSRPQQPESVQSEPSGQYQKQLLSISKVGATSAMANASEHTDPLAVGTSEVSSTSSLLAAVIKSGILSSNSFTGRLSNKISQDAEQMPSLPSLPNGPSPSGFATSGIRVSGSSSHDALAATTNSSHGEVEHLPLLPGLPPPALVSYAPSLTSDAESKASTPVSNLLSSLVAKGLICASELDASSLPSLQMPTQMQKKSQVMEKPTQLLNKSLDVSTSSSLPASPIPSSSAVPRCSTMDEVSFAKPSTESSVASHKSTSMVVENLIGIEFRPDIIKGFHSSVISGLLDDLPHCCSLCGLKLKLQEQLDRHLEWHAIRKTESEGSDRALRGWYARSDNWIAGKPGHLVYESAGSVKQLEKTTEEAELMVAADENQYACLLCGELFEDYFCQDRGEWMFKGAVYLNIPSKDGEVGNRDESAESGPIVHANCMSEISAHDLGLAGGIEMEKEE